MSCYSPRLVKVFGKNPETGKKLVKMLPTKPMTYEEIRKYFSDSWKLVPCGQCLGCRLDYAKRWAERCSLEASMYEENCFITLTYDDDHLPKLKVDEYGEVYSPVVKRDVQLFIKRLRKQTGKEIKYFLCGEYGEKTHRPHYHIIVFGWKPDDLVKYGKNSNGDIIYHSAFVYKLWPYGFNTIGEATFNSAGYVARYVMKKLKGKQKSDEFLLMSRRPGIGTRYIEQHKDLILANERIYFNYSPEHKTSGLNRFVLDHLNVSDSMREKRALEASQAIVNKLYLNHIDEQEDLYSKELNILQDKVKRLRRNNL